MSEFKWTEEDARTAFGAVVKRATSDMDFRNRVLGNPAAAVVEETGKPLPEGFVIRVVENNGADLTVVLPDAAGRALNDNDLEAVAGGREKRNPGGLVTYICAP